MPPVPEFINSCQKYVELHRKKNNDYAVEDDPFSNFKFAELLSSMFDDPRDKVYATLMGIKIARLANLRNKGGIPSNESIEDSFDDLAVYTILFKCDFMDRNRSKRLTEAQIEKANTA